MESEIECSSRICPIIPSPKKDISRHLKPRKIIIAVSLITILSTSALSNYTAPRSPIFSPPIVPEMDKLVCITTEEFYSLEPTRGSWFVSSFYDTLVSYDRDRTDRFQPLLVTEVPSLENGRISPDGLTYRFTVRNDSPLTPEDVEYSIERAMVRGSTSTISLLRDVLLGGNVVERWCNTTGCYYDVVVDFEDIDNAVETEGNDVVFHLARMDNPFMDVLASSSCSILSKAWCVEHGDWPGTEETWEDYLFPYYFPLNPPLDYAAQEFGPFILERLTIADLNPLGYTDPKHITEIVLVRNDNYWRGPARLKRVEIKWIGDWETRKEMLLDGDADVCSVPEDNYTELAEVEGIRVYTGLPTLEYRGLYFNFATANNSPYIGSGELDGNGVPPDFFSDLDIRKAFAYSIDYDTIINEVYAGEGQQPASPVIEGLSFHNPDQESYTYDPDMARQHFQQAWDGEVWDKGFNVTLVFRGLSPILRNLFPDSLAIPEIIKYNIEAINMNFHVTILPCEGVSWNLTSFCIDNHSPGPGLRYLTNQGPPDRDLFWGFGTIFHGYNGSTFDSLIEAGMNTLDPAERQVIYNDYQRIYHEVVPGVPLAQPTTRHYQRDWVWGWYYNPAAAGMDFYEMLKGTCQDAIRNIIAHVASLADSGVMGADAGSSLTETLDSAITHMDNGSLGAASQKLNDFIDQVNALDLPVENREELIALAQEIIEVLISTISSILMDQTATLPDLGLVVGLPIAAVATIAMSLVWKRKYH